MIIIIFFVLQTILYLNVIIKKVSPNLGIFRFIVFCIRRSRTFISKLLNDIFCKGNLLVGCRQSCFTGIKNLYLLFPLLY